MALPRAAWKGYLKISLVSLPVQAFVGSGGGENSPIRLNQLHRECHSRIKYQKTCPIHGEVGGDDIISGYEFAKDQYVEIEPDELAKLRPAGDRAISIESFVPPDAIDSAYLAGKTYYLLPDGQIGQKAYQLICEAMESEGLNAVGRMMITTREHLVRVRPVEGVLAVDLLEYAAQVRTPDEFKGQLADTSPTAPEMKLTRQLIGSMAEDSIDLSQYEDPYASQMRALIEAKVEGKELVTPSPVEEPQVVNLMDALRKSMERTKKAGRPAPRKVASAAKRPAVKSAARKKRSG
jgi:DNA end-binding protein Ku